MRDIKPTQDRIALAATALGVAMAAILTGIYIAIVIVAPMFPNATSGIATARDLSKRFEPRTVDLNVKYPDPSPYRTPTPKFEVSGAPPDGTLAKQKAQSKIADRGLDIDGSQDRQDANGWFGQRSKSRYQPTDRHTANMF